MGQQQAVLGTRRLAELENAMVALAVLETAARRDQAEFRNSLQRFEERWEQQGRQLATMGAGRARKLERVGTTIVPLTRIEATAARTKAALTPHERSDAATARFEAAHTKSAAYRAAAALAWLARPNAAMAAAAASLSEAPANDCSEVALARIKAAVNRAEAAGATRVHRSTRRRAA
jgi:hypothetical protein